MRLSAGMAMAVQGVLSCWPGHRWEAVVFQALSIGLGYSCSRGYGRRGGNAGGGRGAVECLFVGHPWRWIMLQPWAPPCTDRPGAWSIDARLFGWRRLEIRDRKTRTRLLKMSEFPHP